MLIASNYILNRMEQEMVPLHPWVHSFCNHYAAGDQVGCNKSVLGCCLDAHLQIRAGLLLTRIFFYTYILLSDTLGRAHTFHSAYIHPPAA